MEITNDSMNVGKGKHLNIVDENLHTLASLKIWRFLKEEDIKITIWPSYTTPMHGLKRL